jgi:hypothetical protein
MKPINDAVALEVYVPAMPDKGAHHVISRGQKPYFYRIEDLRDHGPGHTAWVEAFQKLIVGLHWVLGKPVPYVFRTPDGTIRSLDAGCIKMLLNRKEPDLAINCDHEGFIDSVVPSDRLLDLYQPIRHRLEKQYQEAGPDD